MSHIRFRLFVLLLFAAGITVFGSHYFYKLYKEVSNNKNLIEQSYNIEGEVHKLNSIKSNNKQIQIVENLRNTLKAKNRKEFLKELLLNYTQKNFSLFRKNLKLYEKNELHFRTHYKNINNVLEKKLFILGASLFALCLFSIILTLVMLQVSLFRPLKDLSDKMKDFVNRKYSYQFAVPPNNEVGDLQLHFNAMAQKVLTQLDALESLDHAKSEFLSIASHELRTPLTSIKGSLSLLKSGITEEFNEATLNLLDIAEVESDRLIRLINDILDLTKIEAQQFPLHKDWIVIEDLIKKTFDSLMGLAQSAQVQLKQEGFEKIYALVDSDRIQQVITNLLSNAIKFSPQNGAITVSASVTEDEKLVVEVIDQGPGISPEDQKSIFQKFRQATSPKNPLVKGTGLGLAIAKALIEEHGGEINLQSKPGEGSNFFFTLTDWKYKHGSKVFHPPIEEETKVGA